MSKMSQLHADLTSQAAELGFASIHDAEQGGYHIVWENGDCKLKKRTKTMDEKGEV